MKNSILSILAEIILLGCNQNHGTLKTAESGNELVETYREPIENRIAKFISDGYLLLDSASGDLNLDEYSDKILILKKVGEEITSDIIDNPEKRPLLVLIGQENGDYRLAAKSYSTVYCYDCGGMMGDPYQGVTIKDGYFSIEHYGGSAWRWTRIITFRFSKDCDYWFLHRDGGESFHVSEPDGGTDFMRTKEDFGKVKFEDFDIFKEID